MKRSLESDVVAPLPGEVWVLVALYLTPDCAQHLMHCSQFLYDSLRPVRLALRPAMALKLWYVERHDKGGYDTYLDFVCCCAREWEARSFHPHDWPVCESQTVGQWLNGDPPRIEPNHWLDGKRCKYDSWIQPSERHLLKMMRLGTADPGIERGVVCASFHAG